MIKEKYSEGRINMICQLLQNESKNGTPKDYDVRIDELKIISRTSDPELFMTHEEFLRPESKSICIHLYDGNSKRCVKYMLLLQEEQTDQKRMDKEHKEVLAGIENTITEKISKEKMQWQFDLLEKENEELKSKIAHSENVIDDLQAQVDSRASKFTETIVSLAGTYLQNNPNALSGVPIIGGLLSGPAKDQNFNGQGENAEDKAASFERADATKSPERQIVEGVTALFGGYKPHVMAILGYMHKQPQAILTLHAALGLPDIGTDASAPNPVNNVETPSKVAAEAVV